jgi:hypothetical protein
MMTMSDENYMIAMKKNTSEAPDATGLLVVKGPDTAVTAVMPNDGGWNAPPDEESNRQIVGELLRWDKEWLCGKQKTPIEDGTRFLAVGMRSVWKRWENGVIVETKLEIDGHYPKRGQLGHDDETQWPLYNSEPSDPWKNAREVVLMDPRTFEQFTFVTDSVGGRSAVDDLKTAVQMAQRVSAGVVPVVELSHKPMPTRYNRLGTKPYFHIAGWHFPDGVTELIDAPRKTGGGRASAIDSGMNDDIPF